MEGNQEIKLGKLQRTFSRKRPSSVTRPVIDSRLLAAGLVGMADPVTWILVREVGVPAAAVAFAERTYVDQTLFHRVSRFCHCIQRAVSLNVRKGWG